MGLVSPFRHRVRERMRERESKIKCESKHTNAYAQKGLEEMKDLRGSKIIIG